MSVFKLSLWKAQLVGAPGHFIVCYLHIHKWLNESIQGIPIMQGTSTHFPAYMGPHLSEKCYYFPPLWGSYQWATQFSKENGFHLFPCIYRAKLLADWSKVPRSCEDYMCGTQIFQHMTALVLHIFTIFSHSPAHVPSSSTCVPSSPTCVPSSSTCIPSNQQDTVPNIITINAVLYFWN